MAPCLLPLAALHRPRAPRPESSCGAARRAVFHVEEARRLLEHRVLGDVCFETSFGDRSPLLGRGGFGAVYRGRLQATGRECAVKVVSKGNPEAARWARREAEVLRGLKHENVCSLLDAFEDEENVYLVLEVIRGHDLFEEIATNHKMDEARAAGIMRQVLEALAYCHEPELGIVHRDVKPENLMLQMHPFSGAPEVKLIDFGLAMACGEDGVQTKVVGTAEFLAPESLASGVYSRASDMWSVGVVLQMLLGGGPAQAWLSPCSAAKTPSSSVLDGLGGDLARSLMRREPCERLSAREALGHPWTMGRTPLGARPESVLSLFDVDSENAQLAAAVGRSALAAMGAFDAFEIAASDDDARIFGGERLVTRLGDCSDVPPQVGVAADAECCKIACKSPCVPRAPHAPRKMHGHRRILRSPVDIENLEPNSLCRPA